MTKEQAREKIKQLIERYQNLTPQEKLMNEEMTKTKFIRPLFEALGWNFEEDVLLEDKISHGRVDYNFQIDGKTKFFLEAKPLKADIDNLEYAKQATNYAWLKNVNWVVLTDFEGIRIFYPAERGQVKSFIRINMDNFLESFEKLWFLSKESFQNNLLDKEAAEYGAKPEEIKVGQQLSEDMNNWRLSLSEHFKTWNSKLIDKDIDEGVQKILDRFIFVRSCEDRKLENDSLRSKYRIWQDDGRKGNFLALLKPFFAEYKKNYNSGLFDDHPVMDWNISSECFDEIINGLYKSKNGQEYDFAIIDADVLGGVYEQYLGHLLSKSADGDASKKKRKSQGIYYTPTFIVDYIVQNTLGKVLQEKSSDEIVDLKILDPACGSGSFLIKAFDYMVDYEIQKQNPMANLKTKLGKIQQAFQRRDGLKEPSTADKLQILRNNIYGVDLDEQAVEIAQLNLLLKTLDRKQELPHLSNIKCGNSLIDDPKIAGDRAFNWNDEFSEIMKSGGFDVIIGNPPYIDSEHMVKEQPLAREFISKNFVSAKGNWDIYCVFIEQGLKLLKEGGLLGFIIPNKLISADYAQSIRELIDNYNIVSIRDYSDFPVFSVGVYPIVIIIQKKSSPNQATIIEKVTSKDEKMNIAKEVIAGRDWASLLSDSGMKPIYDKIIQESKILGDIATVSGAMTVGEAYLLSDFIKDSQDFNNVEDLKLINSGTIDRYGNNWGINKINYIKKSYLFPIVKKSVLSEKMPNRLKLAEKQKIIIACMTKRLECFLDMDKVFFAGKSTTLVSSDEINLYFLVALTNSKLMNSLYKYLFSKLTLQGGYLNIGPKQIEKMPIITNYEESKKDQLIDLAQKMIDLNKQIREQQQGTNQWNQINSEIQKIDKLIDQKVYELYGLTGKEIEIVEGSTNGK